ncbi:hypothetical protein CJ030_MR8G008067 [Morella rubra]|uniref:Disease resistance protein At4g27190-like leucine-rich repeats domain-containing protein n=1 Tax=Morella rubra TaxID=262757 RepID=A0A6A1UQ24_9ROSI|nr:hypothetical protein CJ030_MR8G008067 [Morella rubra]
MRTIVVKEGGEIKDGDRILFPQLEKLVLDSLPKLLGLLSKGSLSIAEAGEIIPEENNEFYMPVLREKHLCIEKCPKFMTFIFNPVSSSTIAREEDREMTTDKKPHKVMQPLFNEEVAMPKLELLTISHIDGMESMWHNRFTANSCCKLRQVNVQQCANLKSFFPTTMMKVLGRLELLIIDNCGSLTKVFDIEVPSFQEMGAMTAT